MDAFPSRFAPKRQPYSLVGLLAFVLVIVAGVFFIVVWKTPSHQQILSVQSGSMQPLITKGDAVLTSPIKPGGSGIKPGEIISYRSPINTRVVITHRVETVDSTAHTIVTKGDNNTRADAPFDSSFVVGKVDGRIPKIGYALDALHSTVGLVLAIYIPALLVVLLEMRRLTTYYRPTYALSR